MTFLNSDRYFSDKMLNMELRARRKKTTIVFKGKAVERRLKIQR